MGKTSIHKKITCVYRLFGLFVVCVLTTMLAVFEKFESILEKFFVFSRKIVDLLTLGTLKLYHVVL